MFCGHTDTVGVAGMARPFEPDVRNGRLYGRGSQDMKGGVAAMIGAARHIVEAGGLDAGQLIVAAVVDEEHSSLGAEALVRTWSADAAVVTEPTALDVAVAHKGFQWVAVETRGRAAHGSRPLEGRDAILRMGRVLAALEALDGELHAGRTHPLLGTASLHASLIHGGQELSSYPDRAWLEFERRTLPGESSSVAVDEIDRIVMRLEDADAEFEAERKAMLSRDAYEIDAGVVAAPGTHARGASRRLSREHRRHDLLDRRGHPGRGRHSGGHLRTRRSRPAQHGGVRDPRGRHQVLRRAHRAGATGDEGTLRTKPRLRDARSL